MSWVCKQCGKANDSNRILCECGHKWSPGDPSGKQAPSVQVDGNPRIRTATLIAGLITFVIVTVAGYCFAGWSGVFGGWITVGGAGLAVFCIRSYALGKYDPESGESAIRDAGFVLVGSVICLFGVLILYSVWTEQYEKTGMRWHVPIMMGENAESLYLRGKAFCDKGDNAAGVPLIRQAVEKENASSRDRTRPPWVNEALHSLALLYANGAESIPKDSAEAIKLFTQLADDQNPDSQYELGTIYIEGKYGVKPNSAEAIRWYEKAALNHQEEAADRLAEILYAQKDYKRALPWITQRAGKDDNEYQYRLAMMYMNGWGVERDYGKAEDWLWKAQQKKAIEQLLQLYRNGHGRKQNRAEVIRDLEMTASAFRAAGH